MSEITPNYQLEWEYKALEELLVIVKGKWKTDYESYKKLSEINSNLLNTLEKDKIGTRLLTFTSEDKNLADFFKRFLYELITSDPFLTRIYLYNSTMPHELPLREGIKKHHLPDQELRYLKDLLHRDFLVDSDLAKSLRLKGIPLRMLFVGKLLDCLFNDFRHYYLIDRVAIDIKMRTGEKASIEELRNERITQTKEGMIYDYSPLIKITITINNVIYEVFKNEDYEKVNEKELSWLLDELLCFFMQKTKDDERKNLYFGDDFNPARFKFLVRYEKKEKEIPFQLLPKWQGGINKIIRKYDLTKLKDFQDGINIQKEDEKQVAMEALYSATVTREKHEGSATNILQNKITWELGKAFERLSTTSTTDGRITNKPMLKEKFDSAGGRLDGAIDKDDEGKGSIKNNLNLNKYDLRLEEKLRTEKITLSKLLSEHPEIKSIIDKEKKGEPLSDNERQVKSRFIRKEKDKFRNI